MISYIDTHIAVWLYAGLTEKLTKESRRHLNVDDLFLSPMALLEMQCLYNRKRISVEPMAIYTYLHTTFQLTLCSYPFPAVATEALTISWTSDPFDRIIVAQASVREASLVTADQAIRTHFPGAIW